MSPAIDTRLRTEEILLILDNFIIQLNDPGIDLHHDESITLKL